MAIAPDTIKIGDHFRCSDVLWLVTDIGTRTVIAIRHKHGWMAGPPYAQVETAFDENDMAVCEPVTET